MLVTRSNLLAYFSIIEHHMPKHVKKGDLPRKVCERCGREMVWRKAWAKTWDEVKYCSEKCKRGQEN